MKKKEPKFSTESSAESDEDFATLLEDHLQRFPPSSKTEEPKRLHRNKPAHKKSSNQQMSIDLHGMNLAEAKQHLSDTWQRLQQSHTPRIVLRIITGKGLHSGSAGPVLVEEIYDYAMRIFGKSVFKVDENPSKVRLSGLPLRGHFDVELHIK